MAESYARQLLRWRWLALLMSLVMIMLMASGGKNLVFNNDYRVFFSEDNPQLQAFENLQDTYTKNDNVIIALAPKDGNVFTRETLKAVYDLTEKSWQTPYSIRVDSLSNFQHTYAEEDDLIVIDLFEDPESLSDAQLAEIREIALAEPLLNGRIVSPQGHVTGVNITTEMPMINPTAEVPEVANFARELADQIRADYPHLDVYLSGVVMMNNAFPEAAQYDMKTLVPLAFAAILVMLVLLLRSFPGVLGTSLVILMSIMGAMGLAGHIGYELSPPVMSAPTIILTMAVADCVHILVTWRQQMQKGLEKNDAMIESLRINFGPIFLTTITTILGFLSLNFSDAPPFRYLGNISAMGVGIAFILSVVFLPALVTLLPGRAKQVDPGKSTMMSRLAEFVIEKRKQLMIGMGIVILVLIAFIPRNELNDVFVYYFDERIDFRNDSIFIADNLTGMYFVDYSIDAKNAGGIQGPEFLRQLEDLSQWLRTQSEVLHVNTITDIMKRLNKNMHGDDEQKYSLPEQRDLAAQYLLLYEMSLPYGLDLNNQINIDKSATRLSVTLKILSTNEVLDFEQRVYNWMQENTPDITTYGASPTVMFAHIGKRNVNSMLIGTAVALVLISLLMIVALRSLKYGLISLMPNLFPAGMAFGIWGLTVGEVGLSLSVVAAMTLGIVVDDTVHFLSKYLRARREQGLNAQDAVRYAFNSVGVALWVTTAALIAGFLVLATSAFELNAGMGLLVAITIALALIADFLFLPPVLMKIEEKAEAESNSDKDDDGEGALTAEPAKA